MKRFALALALLLACHSGLAQNTHPAQTVTVRNLTLVNLTQVPVEDYQQIVQFALGQDHRGNDWPAVIPHRVRYALQQRGYYRAEVADAQTTILSETPDEKIVDVAVRVDPGSVYKLDQLMLGGNKAFEVLSADQMRAHLPISPGDIFDVEKVRVGLENLRKLYSDDGYINFTPVPRTEVIEATKGVILEISLDVGARFYFGELNLTALRLRPEVTQAVIADWSSLKGKPYNETELEDFMKQHLEFLPSGFRPERNLEIRQDAKSHTVAVEVLP